MTVRYAVVGCGGIANGYHLPALSKLEGGRFMVACDLIEERATRAADDFGAEEYTLDYREIMGRDDIDLVCIFTKIEAHAEIALAAIEGGHHVFMQKSFGRTLREGQSLIDAATAKGTLLITSFMHSYFDESVAAAEWVRSGKIGEIEFVRQRNATSNPRHTAPSYGGALSDIGSHGIDLIRTVTGMDIVAVCAQIDPDIAPPPDVPETWDAPCDRPLAGGEANAYMLYKLSGGATACHEVQWAARGGCSRFQMEIYGTKGSLFLRIPRTGQDFELTLVDHEEDREIKWQTPDLPGNPMGYTQHRRIFDAVISGQADPPGSHGMAVLRVVDGARRSAESGGWVTI